MTLLDDLIDALARYPAAYVTLDIVDLAADGIALNVGEDWTFGVRVTNNGPLDLTRVTLKVMGRHGALVRSGSDGGTRFAPAFITAELPTIDACGATQIGPGSPYRFGSPDTPQIVRPLVQATLHTWAVDLSHIPIKAREELDLPTATYAAAVLVA